MLDVKPPGGAGPVMENPKRERSMQLSLADVADTLRSWPIPQKVSGPLARQGRLTYGSVLRSICQSEHTNRH